MNGEILYQEYDYKYTEEGGNDNLSKWYWLAPNYGDKMFSWIHTKGDELIFRSNIHSERGDQLNASYVNEINTYQLNGRSKNDHTVRY